MTSKYEGFPGPDEIEGDWDWDKIHAPRPLTPLAGDTVVMSMGEGFTMAQHDFGSPLALKCRMVNYYLYATFEPEQGYRAQERQPTWPATLPSSTASRRASASAG